MPTMFYTYCRNDRRTDNRHKDAKPSKGKPFSGKKAAPFKKGGGRNPASPRTHKGQPRKK